MERLDNFIQSVGPWGYLVLGLAALIEYVFPPFPGDSVMLLGGVYAARGQRPWALVLLALTVGSVLGATIDFFVGKGIAARLERRKEGEAALPRRLARLHELQQQMRRRGALLLVANRFLPGIRALIFLAAGAAGMRLPWVLLWGGISAVLFNGIVLGLGIAVGGNVEQLGELVARYQRAVYVLLSVVALALLVRWLSRRKEVG